MEHKTKGRKLSRTASHKRALMSNLSISLIKHKRIKTTEAKAKELRLYIEPLVTKAKKATLQKDSDPAKNVHLRRIAKKFLKDDGAVKELFDEIGPKVGDRPGGYTRVLKMGHRFGDGGNTAIIEFVDYNYIAEKEEKAEAEDDKSSKKKDKVKETKETKSKEPKSKVKETDAKEEKPEKKVTKKKDTAEVKEGKKKESKPKAEKTDSKETTKKDSEEK